MNMLNDALHRISSPRIQLSHNPQLAFVVSRGPADFKKLKSSGKTFL